MRSRVEKLIAMSSSETIEITVDGSTFHVARGMSVAAALLRTGILSFRRSITQQARAPLCGMGICFECRVTIDGRAHVRSCMVSCSAGMNVLTDA